MFQFIQKHKTALQVVMTIMFVPFAFSGVSSVMRDNGGNEIVAKVGTHEISQRTFETEFQRYKTQKSQELGDQYNDTTFDSFESRQAFLNTLIDEAVLKEAVEKEHLSVSDSILQQALLTQAPKDAQGKVDLVKYEAMTRAQGMTPAQFEANARSILSSAVVDTAATSGNQILPLEQDYLQKVYSKVQLVEQKNIDPAPFLAAVTVTPEQVTQYYQAHPAEFTRPAAFELEYAIIPVLPANYNPTDDEIKAAFGGNATASDIASVRADAVKLKQVAEKAAQGKMEGVAKQIIEASAAAPKDLKAIVAKFGGKIETAQGVTRKGGANLPAALMLPDVREALTTSEMAASNALGSPVAYGTNLVVGRAIKSNPAGLQPIETVQAEIETKLKQQQALVKMRAQADTQLASMSPTTSIGAAMPMGILLKHTISPTALSQVVAVNEYPKLLVSEGDNGVSILRVVGSAPSVSSDQAVLKQQIANQQALATELQRRAFFQTLRERYNVKVYVDHLGGADNPAAKAKV